MTEKKPSNRSGARPNSGPKVNIEKNLIYYRIALSFDVGLDRARELMSEYNHRPEFLIGKDDVAKMRKAAQGKDAELSLKVVKELYAQRRKQLGFKS
jgi:hypothetical protein